MKTKSCQPVIKYSLNSPVVPSLPSDQSEPTPHFIRHAANQTKLIGARNGEKVEFSVKK